MKEATGELNMTVITVLVIAALGVIVTTIVIPIISGGIEKSAACASAYNCIPKADGKSADCKYDKDVSGVSTPTSVNCPIK